MKNLVFLLIILGIATFIFAGSWEEAYWSNQNPFIYHFLNIEIWSTSAMHPALESLELEKINTGAIGDEKTKTALENAISSKSKAAFSKSQCEALYTSVVLELPSGSLEIAIFGPMTFITKVFKLMAIEILNGAQVECGNYGKYWKQTMSYSESALEESHKKFANEFEVASDAFYTVKNAGLCDDDFSGASKEICKGAEFKMAALLMNEYIKITGFADVFETEGKKNVGNFSGYASTVNMVWVSGIPKAAEIKGLSDGAITKAKENYEEIRLATEVKMANAKQEVKKLDNEKMSAITESKYAEESTGTINKRYEKLVKNLREADWNYVNSTLLFSSTYGGYLKKGINEMKIAYSKYESIALESGGIFEDAKDVTGKQRKEAEEEIADFEKLVEGKAPGSAAKKLYESALEKLQKGDSALWIGEKFSYYASAAADARKAMVKQQQSSAELEVEVNAALKRTQNIISNAKKDGIDVYLEEAELQYLVGINEEWAIERLCELSEGLLDKGYIRYGYLEDKRKKIMQKINLAEGRLDDLLAEMEKVESGAFLDGRLNTEKGLGKLANIAKEYQYIEAEIEKEMKKIVANGLKKDVTVEMGGVELDVPVDISIMIFIYNPYAFDAKEVLSKIAVPIEIKENEITEGAEFVSAATYSSGMLNLYINEIRGYEKQTIKFEKQAITATVLKKEKKTVGNPDGTADSEEKITFDLAYDVNGVYVPSYFESWNVDGKTVVGRKTGKLTKGEHVLSGRHKIEEAFETIKQDYRAISAGLNSEVSYDLVVVPKIDLGSATIMVSSEDSDSISGFSVTSYSSVGIKNKKALGNGMYSFDVTALENGKNATFRIKYTISNSAAYVAEQLSILKNAGNSKTVESYIKAAELAIAGNDTRRAVENIEKAKHQIEKEDNEKIAEEAKLERTKETIKIQKDEVEKALEDARTQSLNTQLTAKLEARNNTISDCLKASTTAELSDFDYGWAKKEALSVRKNAFEKYNKLKEEYLKINNGVANESEFIQFEAAMAKLEASGTLDAAVLVEKSLQDVEQLVNKKTKAHGENYDAIAAEASILKEESEGIIGKYAKEYDAAKGSPLLSLFTYDYKNAQKELKALDNLVAKKAASEVIGEKISEIKKINKELKYVLDYLAKEGPRKLESVKAIYDSKKDALGENDKKLVEQGLIKMEEQLNKGNYAEAISTGDAIIKIIGKSKEKDQSGLIVLGLTALFVIGALAIYIMRGKGFGFSGRSGPKILRKLRSADEL